MTPASSLSGWVAIGTVDAGVPAPRGAGTPAIYQVAWKSMIRVSLLSSPVPVDPMGHS